MRLQKFQAMVLVLSLSALARGQNAATSQPTVVDVQTLVDAKEYSAAIKVSSKLLSMRGPSVAGMSRFELTMLKGDAQVGAKSISTAISTYKSASLETKDPHELALSHWTAELFHTAASVTYTPKIGVGMQKRGPFNLMDADQRKQGFEALLEDNLSLIEPKLKAATVTQSLPQIWPVIQQVVDLSQLDEIANGSDDKTAAIASALLDHSRNLLSNLVKEYWARLGDIDAHANATVTSSQSAQSIGGQTLSQTITTKNGLSQSNRSELQEMISTCKKVREAAEELMKFAKTDQGWNTILADANRVGGRAGDVLNTDYSSISSSTTSGDPYNTGLNGTGINGGFGGYGTGTTIIVRGGPTTRPGGGRTRPPTTRP